MFDELPYSTQLSMIFAMYLRNRMEDFHCKHLTDEQMKELNPIIRQALYNAFRYLELTSSNDAQADKAIEVLNFQKISIPDYWELPLEEDFQDELDFV